MHVPLCRVGGSTALLQLPGGTDSEWEQGSSVCKVSSVDDQLAGPLEQCGTSGVKKAREKL
jgi:hypothetical protein